MAGSAACTDCPMGTFSGSLSQSCMNCSAGYFNARMSRPFCDACNPGTYAPSSGFTECLDCQVGRSTNGANASTSCSVCPAGTYATGGNGVCTPAAKGYFSPIAGSNAQLLCPDNVFTPYLGMKKCVPCPPGTTRLAANQGTPSLVGCLNSSGLPVGLDAYIYYAPDYYDLALLPSSKAKDYEGITYGVMGGVFLGVVALVVVVALVKRAVTGYVPLKTVH